MREEPNGRGLSRKAILFELDQSLRRLQTDYVDLYQIHRWDYETPIEETLEALHDVVKAGKVRYIGASSMYAWQFAKALYLADLHGWTRFVSMQNHYNLLYREEEREMIGLCASEGHRRDSLEPAGARAAGAALAGGDDQALRDRPVRQDHVFAHRGRTIARSWTGSARSPKSAAFRAPRWRSPGCWLSRSDRAHRGRNQAASSRGRRRGALAAPDSGGNDCARRALHRRIRCWASVESQQLSEANSYKELKLNACFLFLRRRAAPPRKVLNDAMAQDELKNRFTSRSSREVGEGNKAISV